MSFIKIPIFDGGLVTNADPEDIQESAAISSVNFETDVPGKLVKRTGRGSTSTINSDHVGNITKWTNQDLANPVWVYFETQGDKIKTCAANFTSAADVSTITGSGNVQISNFGRVLRFANDLANKAGIYQTIDRQFFFGSKDLSSGNKVLDYDQAAPRLPGVWENLSVSELGTGLRQSGHYYYMFVPIFDGVQEHPKTEGFSYYELPESGSDENKVLKVGLKMNKGTGSTDGVENFNPRITAIKVYRSYSPSASGNIDPVYYHIKTIPLNTKSDHDDAMGSETARIMNNLFYSPDLPSATPTDWGGNAEFKLNNDVIDDTVAWDGKTLTKDSGDFTNSYDGSWSFTVTPQGSNISTIASGSTGGYRGKNLLYKSDWDWFAGEADGRVAFKASTIEDVIIRSIGSVVKLSSDQTATSGQTNNISGFALSNGYRYDVSSDNVTVYFYDYDYADGSLHPLRGKTKITVNHKYSAYLGGRQFVGNVRLDPDGDAEDHQDWIIFSEVGQPDVLPITNYIQIKDVQGGQITGLSSQLGSLIVFMERGIYRLDIPSTDPTRFSLLESEENFGCIAPNSIVTIGNQTFFAGEDNAYVMDGSFNIESITEPIKDVYQAKTNLENSRFFYDPKKGRLLCRLGDDKQNIYCFDVKAAKAGKAIWYQLDMGSTDVADLFAIDENLDVYTITNT